MVYIKQDIKSDIKAAVDRGENVSAMEPLLIGSDSRHLRNIRLHMRNI